MTEVKGAIKVKICGMRDPANIEAVAALSPDYLGFIEHAPSPRYVGSDFSAEMYHVPGMSRVGVFVNETIEAVRKRAKVAGYNAIQLHGDESPEFAEALKDEGFEVIKVFRVGDAFRFSQTRPFAGKVDLFLFDAQGKHPGGNGIRFNWEILLQYDQKVPFFLSGGLQPDTLSDDLKNLDKMNLYGVDLNSGVERSPGLKDVHKVKAAIDRVRNR